MAAEVAAASAGSKAIASVLSSLATTAGNIALSERNRNWNEAMQDKQNFYNLPANQIMRLKDAGISPNAVTMKDGMTVQGNTSAGINPITTPDLQDPLGMAANSFLAFAQGTTEEQMRQVRKEQAVKDIELMDANIEKLGVDTQYQSIINMYAAVREQLAIEGEKQRIRLDFASTRKVMQEARKLAYEVDKLLPEQVKQLINEQKLTVAQLDLIIAQIANINADTVLKGKQGDVADTQAALNTAQEGLTSQESARYDELTNQVLAQYQATINKIVAETDLTEQEAFYYLYDLAMKHSVRVAGVPLIGSGGTRNNLNQQDIQNVVRDKYFSE